MPRRWAEALFSVFSGDGLHRRRGWNRRQYGTHPKDVSRRWDASRLNDQRRRNRPFHRRCDTHRPRDAGRRLGADHRRGGRRSQGRCAEAGAEADGGAGGKHGPYCTRTYHGQHRREDRRHGAGAGGSA